MVELFKVTSKPEEVDELLPKPLDPLSKMEMAMVSLVSESQRASCWNEKVKPCRPKLDAFPPRRQIMEPSTPDTR